MTGWRLGFALGPADILGAMRKIHQYTIMSAPTTAQVAAITALTDPAAEEAVLAMRDSYDVRRKLLVDGLNSIGMPTFEPRGAFYAFPDIRASGMTSDDFRLDAAGGGEGGRGARPGVWPGRRGLRAHVLRDRQGQDRRGAGAHGAASCGGTGDAMSGMGQHDRIRNRHRPGSPRPAADRIQDVLRVQRGLCAPRRRTRTSARCAWRCPACCR